MLSIFDRSGKFPRRRLLTAGSLGLGSLSLPALLAARGARQRAPRAVTGKSVVFLFQQGGPSQFETFDPKVAAPTAVRTMTGVIPTRLAGVQFGDSLSRLSLLADQLTVVRSFQTNNGGHNIQPIVGPDSLQTNIGVHYARVAGATHPRTGMPTNAVLYPAAVNAQVPGPMARGNLASTGSYSSAWGPFVPGGNSQLQRDMTLAIDRNRFFTDRRHVLDQLDQLNRKWDATGQLAATDELQQQAYDLLLGGAVAEALDLSREDPRTVARYDTSRFTRPGAWNKVSRGRKGYYNAQTSTLGKLLLLSRRLCEAGCGFVTIHAGYAGIWDMHADQNNLNMTDGMEAVGRSFDHAVASFVEDVTARGLADKILLVVCGEMGRTPKINRNGGRDHWGRLSPLLLFGGGLPGGHVIGQSTPNGGEPNDAPLTPKHLISTILHTVFDIGQLRLMPGVPPQLSQLSTPPPIHS